jgi:hypothetical protein
MQWFPTFSIFGTLGHVELFAEHHGKFLLSLFEVGTKLLVDVMVCSS